MLELFFVLMLYSDNRLYAMQEDCRDPLTHFKGVFRTGHVLVNGNKLLGNK